MIRREALALLLTATVPLAGCLDSSGGDGNGGGDGSSVSFGESVTFTNGIAVSVRGVKYHTERNYTLEGTGEERTDVPDEGQVFAIFRVTARNTNTEEKTPRLAFPGHLEFTLQVGGSKYEPQHIHHPNRYDSGVYAPPGGERSGVIRYQIPEDDKGADPTVILEYLFHGKYHTAQWS